MESAELDVDVEQLRLAERRRMLRSPVTWVTVLGVALLGGVLGWLLVSPAVGVIAFAFFLAAGIWASFKVAGEKAKSAFYDAYGEARGLVRVEGESIGQLTPLLRKGDQRSTDAILRGRLAEGIEGDIVFFKYTKQKSDDQGNTREKHFPFTLIHVEIPEVAKRLPELRVQNRVGFRFLEAAEDKFRLSHERVTLESETLRDRYEIFVRKGQDQIWVRRLFSPSFIVWLTEEPIRDFAFELEDGHLISYLPSHLVRTDALDRLASAGAAVARRLREEAADPGPSTTEGSGP